MNYQRIILIYFLILFSLINRFNKINATDQNEQHNQLNDQFDEESNNNRENNQFNNEDKNIKLKSKSQGDDDLERTAADNKLSDYNNNQQSSGQKLANNYDKSNKLEDSADEYIYIKIKSLNNDEINEEDDDDNEYKNEFTKEEELNSNKDLSVKKTLNIRYEDNDARIKKKQFKSQANKGEESDSNLKDGESKEKEVVLSNLNPSIDILKVKFLKNENSEKIKIEEDDEQLPEPELTKEQELGKKIFEDALTKLESNQIYAFKLIDQAALLGYKEAEDFLLHSLVFGDFDVSLNTLKEKLDHFAMKGNGLAQTVCFNHSNYFNFTN